MKTYIKILLGLFLSLNIINTFAIIEPSTNSGNTVTIKNNLFKLDSVEVIYSDKLKLFFNKDLYTGDQVFRDIKITDKADEFATFQIDNMTASGNTLNVKLNNKLVINHEYEVIIIEVYDLNYSAISKGINAIKLFKTPEVFNTPIIITKTGSINTGNSTSLNSAADVNLDSIFKDIIPKEKAISNNIANTFDTAKNTQRLPTTGPAEWLLLAISLFFGLIYLTFKSKYKN